MKKLRVGIIFGGKTTEHEISLQSAKNISNKIDKKLFEIVFIKIDKQGKWYIYDMKNSLRNVKKSYISLTSSEVKKTFISSIFNKQSITKNSSIQLIRHVIDIIFPVVHGSFGEDGSLQGMLRMINLPFVGSGVQSSSICMDKDVTKRLLRDARFRITPFITLNRLKYKHTFNYFSSKLGLPFFIKPANQGSSIGISRVDKKDQFNNALYLAFKFDHKIIVEKNIQGREIECGVFGNKNPKASVCAEILLKEKFYSYNSKYADNSNSTKIIIPAKIEPFLDKKIRSIAIKAYKTLGCYGMARVDVFLTSKNKIIINEINTSPGFTNTSIFPKLWKASGINCTNLVTRLIKLAIERHAIDNMLKTSL